MLVDSHTHLLRLGGLAGGRGEGGRRGRGRGRGEHRDRGRGLAGGGPSSRPVLPNVYSTAGIHPHNAGTYTAADLETLAELSESPGIVALGEVGLDYYRSEWSREVQQALFEDAISLANDTRLPLVIHSRQAFADTMSCSGERPRAGRPALLRGRRPGGQGGDRTRVLRRPRGKRNLQEQRDGAGAAPHKPGAHPRGDGRPVPEPPARARREERAEERRPHGPLRRREARAWRTRSSPPSPRATPATSTASRSRCEPGCLIRARGPRRSSASTSSRTPTRPGSSPRASGPRTWCSRSGPGGAS